MKKITLLLVLVSMVFLGASLSKGEEVPPDVIEKIVESYAEKFMYYSTWSQARDMGRHFDSYVFKDTVQKHSIRDLKWKLAGNRYDKHWGSQIWKVEVSFIQDYKIKGVREAENMPVKLELECMIWKKSYQARCAKPEGVFPNNFEPFE